jgi:hypothetical protein
MIPGKLNLSCPQGSTFSKSLTYKVDDDPVNLTGYQARLQVREFFYSTEPVLNLSDGSGITLGASAGTINVLINAGTTATLIPGDYVYDLELVAGGTVSRLVEGKFVVTPEVTR